MCELEEMYRGKMENNGRDEQSENILRKTTRTMKTTKEMAGCRERYLSNRSVKNIDCNNHRPITVTTVDSRTVVL